MSCANHIQQLANQASSFAFVWESVPLESEGNRTSSKARDELVRTCNNRTSHLSIVHEELYQWQQTESAHLLYLDWWREQQSFDLPERLPMAGRNEEHKIRNEILRQIRHITSSSFLSYHSDRKDNIIVARLESIASAQSARCHYLYHLHRKTLCYGQTFNRLDGRISTHRTNSWGFSVCFCRFLCDNINFYWATSI